MSLASTLAPYVGALVSAGSIGYLAFTRWRDASAERSAQARLIRISAEATAGATAIEYCGHLHNASDKPIFDAVLRLYFGQKAAVSTDQADLMRGEVSEEITHGRRDPGTGTWRAEFTDAAGLKWTLAEGEEPKLAWKRQRG